MSQILFSNEWLKQYADPYAILGLSVTADDRRVLKRYRDVAKRLHPDAYVQALPEVRQTTSQLFARLVSPAYQKLKQDKGRAEYLAMLRFRVRRMNRDGMPALQGEFAQQLLRQPPPQVETFYEQAISRLAETQFYSLELFEAIAPQLEELNLVYLKQKMGEPIIREKRTGIVSAAPSAPVEINTIPADPGKAVPDYAQRHYDRALEYTRRNSNWAMIVRELKDAIKLDPKRSEFHSLLAKAYLMQDLPTMAKVHFKQALKLNPQDPLALQYAARLNIVLDTPAAAQKPTGKRFSFFGRKP